jgi:hypothetical protein
LSAETAHKLRLLPDVKAQVVRAETAGSHGLINTDCFLHAKDCEGSRSQQQLSILQLLKGQNTEDTGTITVGKTCYKQSHKPDHVENIAL